MIHHAETGLEQEGGMPSACEEDGIQKTTRTSSAEGTCNGIAGAEIDAMRGESGFCCCCTVVLEGSYI